jgi:hypothetical protein
MSWNFGYNSFNDVHFCLTEAQIESLLLDHSLDPNRNNHDLHVLKLQNNNKPRGTNITLHNRSQQGKSGQMVHTWWLSTTGAHSKSNIAIHTFNIGPNGYKQP